MNAACLRIDGSVMFIFIIVIDGIIRLALDQPCLEASKLLRRARGGYRAKFLDRALLPGVWTDTLSPRETGYEGARREPESHQAEAPPRDNPE